MMASTDEKLFEWLTSLSSFSLPSWEELPDLDLYMDQVVTYLERELSPLIVEDEEKMITTWMINNYVKGSLLPNSVKKKYSKDHLAYLLAICSVKQILSIPNIATLFEFQKEQAVNPEKLYAYFRENQSQTMQDVIHNALKRMEYHSKDIDSNRLYLYEMVFKLAIEAQAKKIVAEKILYLLSKSDDFYKDEIARLTKEQLELQKIERERKAKK
ncbi:MAG: DUF1836 domain-containing protein [Bacilli bacterium]|nr:DUF1836 domain-containing protein [Bacilli bacterium]